MNALIKAQWLRLGRRAEFVALALLGLWYFVLNADLFLDAIASLYYMTLVISIVVSALLGWVQLRSVASKNRWAFFIHRPLAQGQIFAAFALSALLLLTVACILPVALALVFMELQLSGLVDARLYLILPFIAGLMMACWFAAAFVVLSPSKLAPLVFVLPALLLNPYADSHWLFITLLVVVLWCGYLAFSAFKPALDSHLSKPLAKVMLALPLQYALAWLMTLVVGIGVQLSLIVIDSRHTGNWNDYWLPDSFNHFDNMTDKALLNTGLKLTGLSPIGADEIVSFDSIEARWTKPIEFNQLFYLDMPIRGVGKLQAQKAAVQWYFSHQHRLFFGVRHRDGQLMGFMDANGKVHHEIKEIDNTQRFTGVPHTREANELYLGHRAYRLEHNQLKPLLELAHGERFANGIVVIAGGFAVLGSKNFYLFDENYQQTAKVPLDTDVQNIARVYVATIDGRHFISVLSGSKLESNFYDGHYRFYLAQETQVQLLASKKLTQDWSELQRYRGFIISPLMTYLHQILWQVIAPYELPKVDSKTVVTQPLPSKVVWLMGLVSLLCLYLAWRQLKRSTLSKVQRAIWLINCAVCAVPGLMTLMLIHHFKPKRPPDSG